MRADGIVGFLVLIGIVAAIIFGAAAIAEVNTPRERATAVARTRCIDLGYQFHCDKLDVWYCFNLGLEPRIVRLGTLAELEVQYER